MKNIEEQYKNDSNLRKRIQIHKFSIAKESWFEFLTRNIQIKDNAKILEVGCGTGALWEYLLAKKPKIQSITLTDFSEEMLKKCEINLKKFQEKYEIQYEIVDAANIPYDAEMFDIVISNHVLYHISDVDSALAKIFGVLKKGGLLYTTTVGENNMSELKNIIRTYFENINNELFSISVDSFSLENACEKIGKYFKKVNRVDHKDALLLHSPKPITEYIESFNFPNILNSEEKIMKFETQLAKKINFQKGYLIHKEMGLITGEK